MNQRILAFLDERRQGDIQPLERLNVPLSSLKTRRARGILFRFLVARLRSRPPRLPNGLPNASGKAGRLFEPDGRGRSLYMQRYME